LKEKNFWIGVGIIAGLAVATALTCGATAPLAATVGPVAAGMISGAFIGAAASAGSGGLIASITGEELTIAL